MYTSDSSASRYRGKPLSVLRVIAGRERFQPRPKGPLPAPESYESESCGPKPERPGLVAMGTVMEPVPVTGLAANFSPMPRMAPPPFGSERGGAEKLLFSLEASLFSLCVFCMFNICAFVTYWGHSRTYSVSTGTFSTKLIKRLYH